MSGYDDRHEIQLAKQQDRIATLKTEVEKYKEDIERLQKEVDYWTKAYHEANNLAILQAREVERISKSQ